MAKFRSVPRPRSEEEFVKSAEPAVVLEVAKEEGAVNKATPAESKPAQAKKGRGAVAAARPWDGLNPSEKATISQTVRLNAYQHEQLKWIASQEDRSLSQVLRRLIGPALDSAT